MTSFLIRPMEPRDAAPIARLAGTLGYSARPDDVAERIARLSRNSSNAVFVAESSDVVGWIHSSEEATLTDGPFVEIRGLVVDERFRKRGTGRALVAAVERWATGRGIRRVRVRTRTERREAHAFYASAGYRLAKTQSVFEKSLTAPAPNEETEPAGAKAD
jgi:GNAT superfamily N-acetyltransferase